MNDQKNTLLAIVLSALVLIGWQFYFGLPQMEKQKQAQQQQQQTQQQPGAPPVPGAPSQQAPGTAPPAPGQPGAPAQTMTREGALAAVAARAHRDAERLRLDRAQGRAHRRSVAHQIPRDGRPEVAGGRAAGAVGQPAPVLRRIRLVRRPAALK